MWDVAIEEDVPVQNKEVIDASGCLRHGFGSRVLALCFASESGEPLLLSAQTGEL